MINLLADVDYSGAANGILGLGALIWVFGIIYGILCFMVPFWIWSIKERTKDNLAALNRIIELLEPPKVEPEPWTMTTPAVAKAPAKPIR